MENKQNLPNKDKFTFFDWFLMVASLIVAIIMVSPFVFVLRSYPVPITDLIFSAILVIASVWEFYKKFKKYQSSKDSSVAIATRKKLGIDESLKFSAIAGILIVASSLAFYFVYYLPNKEQVLESGRKYCTNSDANFMKNNPGETIEDYNAIYKMCMNSRGLAD